MDERQDAADLAVALGIKVMRAVAEALGDDALPAGAVEESRVAAAHGEIVPRGDAIRRQRADDKP
jgi:hypothetical protein